MTRTIIAALALAILMTDVSAQNATTTLRDSRGNVVSRSTTNGNTTTNYDSRGRVISRETTNGRTTMIYDAAGRNLGRFTRDR
jgi:YD repeat-containing protein